MKPKYPPPKLIKHAKAKARKERILGSECLRWQKDQCLNHTEVDEQGYCHRKEHPEVIVGHSNTCKGCPYADLYIGILDLGDYYDV